MFNFMRLPPLRRLMLMKAITGGGSWSTIVGNPVSFTARNAPLKQLKVAFAPKQDLHGYDSPWPAGGGKNKCPDKKYQNNTQSVYIGQDNGTDFPLSLTDTTYTLSFTLAQQMAIDVYIRKETDAGGTKIYSRNIENAVVEVSPSVAGKYRLAIFRQGGISANDISNVQLELGSSATSFAPYSNECPILGWDSLTVYHSGADTSDPQTISISIGQTVYGGTLNVLTGVLTVDSVEKMASSLSWGNNASYANTFSGEGFDTRKRRIDGSNANGCYCDSYKWYTSGEVGSSDGGVALANASSGSVAAQTRIYIKDTRFATAGEFAASLNTNDVKIVCPLAEPLTIQLTPQEVNSLAGDNTMWTDGDSLEVTYRSN